MRDRIVIGLLACALALSANTPTWAAPGAQPVIALTADGLIAEWSAPEPALERLADGTVRISVPGYGTLARPGLPQLPVASFLIALPPGANPSLELQAVEERTLPLPGPLALAPQPQGVERDSEGNVIGGAFSMETPGVSEIPGVLPASVELEELGVLRGARLARLTFYPARPEGGSLRVTTRVRVAVHFNAPTRTADDLRQAAFPSDVILDALKTVVVNPESVVAAPLAAHGAARLTAQTSAPRAVVTVNATGLTQITHEALAASGFPVASVNPQNLRLAHSGIEIAAEWDGDGDASFEPGERLLFFAAPRFSRWTASDGYVLSAETTPGLRMTTRSASPSGLPAGSAWMEQTVETNALYTPDCYCAPIPPGRDGDRWTWDDLKRPGNPGATYSFSVSNVAPTQPATMTVWLVGYTDVTAAPDHRVNVALNNSALGAVEWDGKQAITATLSIPAGVLLNGSNALQLALPGLSGVSVEGAWLDAFAVQFARGADAAGTSALFTGETSASAYTLNLSSTIGLRAYDVTSPNQPVRLSDVSAAGNIISLGDTAAGARRYALAAESGILSPSVRLPAALQSAAGADYVIISPASFVPALADLIALRQSQGLQVVVEDAQAIYDAYDDGRPTPDAIRAYLADAYATWNARPTYVLLVGDGTSDPRRYRPGSFVTHIPPYLADVDPWAGETAADNRYVTLDGPDALPDMLIGRLPVNSLSEAQTVVGKIVQYESAPAVGLWNANIVFVADDADEAGDFAAESDALASAYVAAPFTAQRAYYAPPATTVAAAQQAVLDHWSAGAGLVVFTGHSSIHQWAVERLFHLDDLAALKNGPRLPVVLEMTCFTGAFQAPGLSALDEALVRQPNGGAAAAWGATGLGVSTGHSLLAEGFLQSVFQSGQTELGRAALAGKLRLAANPVAPDLLDTFTLFGDPATRYNLSLNPGYALYLPLVNR
jgi:hypothetical protein